MSDPAGADGDNTVKADDVHRFIKSFLQLQEEIHRLRPPAGDTLREMVMNHLGADPARIAPVGQQLPLVERPNLQLAMNHLMASDDAASLIGLSPEIGHYGEFSFSALLAGRFHGPGDPVPPVYDDHPVDVNKTLRCVVTGIWLVHHEGERAAVCLSSGDRHTPPHQRTPRLEIYAADEQTSASLLEHIQELRHRLNVYRGKVLAFSHDEYGSFGINFVPRPTTAAGDVIMPPDVLESIERHAIEIGRRGPELLAAGQHLKRGLLLYGPPGTGKTHTVSYLLNAMPDRTAVILQGASVGALGYGAAIVRNLTPSMLIIEDIDIIANERGMYDQPGHPLLFELLNEMDGLTPTDDVLFVLTTNRPDVLEPALASRPGRVDHAVEIALPETPERRLLLELYLARTTNNVSNIDGIVAGTDGVTASFMRELVRRATLGALDRSGDGQAAMLTDDDLSRALAELLENALPIGRTSLGLGQAQDPPESFEI